MTQEHPITPPPELVAQWWDGTHGAFYEFEAVATQAARWGADQELKACCEWVAEMTRFGDTGWVHNFHTARRPKPPSLKEQALAELELLRGDANAHGLGFDAPAIRRALESLPD